MVLLRFKRLINVSEQTHYNKETFNKDFLEMRGTLHYTFHVDIPPLFKLRNVIDLDELLLTMYLHISAAF